ncbi:MAG: transglutaminase-like domain-containing protein [Candidatus Aenigmatarchaeota archaeon]
MEKLLVIGLFLLLIIGVISIVYSTYPLNDKSEGLEGLSVGVEYSNYSCESVDRVKLEFMERNYQEVIDQRDGNIPMEVFRERIQILLHYKPQIGVYLDTKNYRYKLPPEAHLKAMELKDDNSYSRTVNNIQNWVVENIEYSGDDRWYTASYAWERRSANCNGISFLTCGMLRDVGIPCVVVGNDEHVWIEYLYLDERGRIVWNVWDQGLEGYPVLSDNLFAHELN